MAMATKETVVSVARDVVQRRVEGAETYDRDGHHFILGPVYKDGKVVGYCSRFVRQTYEVAEGLPEQGLSVLNGGWASDTARHTEEQLKKRGLAVQRSLAKPGDIICMNLRNGPYGHIAIWLGNNTVAENTSSGSRGTPRAPGTKITVMSDGMWSHFSGFYAVLPSAVQTPPQDPAPTGQPKYAVVLKGSVIPCAPQLEKDGHMTLLAEPYLKALGADVATIPAGVIHRNGRAYGAELTQYVPGWVLTQNQFRLTPDGYRWYPQRIEWLRPTDEDHK